MKFIIEHPKHVLIMVFIYACIKSTSFKCNESSYDWVLYIFFANVFNFVPEHDKW